jgi:Zn-dependent protease
MTLSWKLGRIAGIDVFLHPTFLLLLAFVGLGDGGLMGLALVGSAFACVLLHEFGHALTARACGIRTLDITLYPIGGVARLERMPRKPGVELLITAAGPAVNFVLYGLLTALLAVGGRLDSDGGADSTLAAFLGTLASINLLLGAFNLVPAFPMDGGRLLRAGLSHWIGRLRATEIAAGLGKLIAFAFGLWSLLNGHWLQAALAVFVYLAGAAELLRVRAESWGDDSDSDDPRDGGVHVAPPGHRWVPAGRGAWQLAPIPVHDGWSRQAWPRR